MIREQNFQNATEPAVNYDRLLCGVNHIIQWKEKGLKFPFFQLQDPQTWSKKYVRVCPKCAIEILEKERLMVFSDCLAKDSMGNTNTTKFGEIVDYIDWDDSIKEYYSVVEKKEKCSQCGCIPNAT